MDLRDELPDHGPDADDRDDVMDEDEGSGEDLQDNMERDYRPMPNLDRFEEDGLDEDVDEGSIGEAADAREAAERALDARDRRLGGALPGAFDGDDSQEQSRDAARRRRIEAAQAGGAGGLTSFVSGTEEAVPIVLDANNVRGPLSEWVMQDAVRMQIAKHFRAFLETYVDAESPDVVYQNRIMELVKANKQSLEVDFIHLSRFKTALAIWCVDAPHTMLEIFNEEATNAVEAKFPAYIANVHDQIFVRMIALPVCEELRDIRQAHLNTLVRVHGVVTRRTGVYPQLALVMFNCGACGSKVGPYTQTGEKEVKPMQCPNCEASGPFFMDMEQTVYRNYQKISLQEAPGRVPAGRLPRTKNVILLHDLIDVARPGEEIEMTGVYMHGYDATLNAQSGFPVFNTFFEANHVACKADEFSLDKLNEDDITEIRNLAALPDIGERIIDNIAPSIYGHRDIKACIALALFGGQQKLVGSHRLRGDINVLLMGDPGTAKSQFLKYVEKTSTRAVYTTGKGASAVGLTASVTKDAVTGEWTLEGGALVLADRGICLIDEFDKMNDNDRVSIHEAMEQQSISISKAGIVTSLQARCSVIAAANPDAGRYDPSRTFAENVRTLTDPIISRFDCLCVVKDQVDPQMDERLATFVVNSHARSHPDNAGDELDQATGGLPEAPEAQPENFIDQTLLKKYIAYAKRNCHPKLQDADAEKLVAMYTELRREAAVTHAMPVAVRHLESMIRMSEAHACMHLRDHVNAADIDVAIRLMLESFLQAQKYSIQKQLRRKFQRFLATRGDYNQLLLSLLRALAREVDRIEGFRRGQTIEDDDEEGGNIKIDKKKFEDRAKEYNIPDVAGFYSSRSFLDNKFSVAEDGQYLLMAR